MGELFGDLFVDIGLLYGRAGGNDPHHVSAAAGPAVIFITQRCTDLSGTCEPEETTVGLALAAQYFVIVSGELGLGFNAFANINAVQPFAGVTLSLNLGKMR